MSRQTIHGPVGQLAAGDIHNHNHHHPPPPVWPPDDPLVAQCCPQCGRRTWRYSRHCIHCALDLAAWRWAQRIPIVRRRLALAAAAFAGAGVSVAGVAFALDPAPSRALAWGVSGLLVLLACLTWVDSLTAHNRRPPAADQLPLH